MTAQGPELRALADTLRESVDLASDDSAPMVRIPRGTARTIISALERAAAADREVEFALSGTWLFENVNRHTCGTGPDGHYGAHEPGCGQEPVVDLATLPGFAILASAAEGEKAEADEGPGPFHSMTVENDNHNAAGTLHRCTGGCGWGWRGTHEDALQRWSDAHTFGDPS